MSKTFQPDSLHPYIMDARLKKATGSGGISSIPIASAETLGGIKVPADSGMSVDADGAISGVPYSTNEHKTGRKWIDGKDIYEKTFQYTPASADGYIELNTSMNVVISIVGTLHDVTNNNYFDINSYLTSSTFMYAYVNTSDSKLMYIIPNNLINMEHTVTIQYTKPTP